MLCNFSCGNLDIYIKEDFLLAPYGALKLPICINVVCLHCIVRLCQW